MLPDNHFYSALLGYISLGTCVAIELPQLFLHWRKKSAEGISLTMMWLWLIGDSYNYNYCDVAFLIGAIVQGLLHTLIILGGINGVMDTLLIYQCYYYSKWQQFACILPFLRRPGQGSGTSSPPDLSPPISPPSTDTNQPPLNKPRGYWYAFYHSLYVLFVIGASVMVWGLVVARVRKSANLRTGDDGTDPEFDRVGAAFGWLSMIIYTSSRYPQIYKNWKSKSCHNLSIWFFVLLIIYNTTNIASILIKSTEKPYLKVNLPWIVNYSFNVILDLVIMGQFTWYREIKDNTRELVAVAPRPGSVGAESKEAV
ncbi:unnamed protein product [Rhizoctonia solani]|uniref:Uncharacterized protein n=1 Tax=Rhizoctonia solani TaxID=456999 RepID=A0A8H3BGS4_9AGAM|nr:unnamed protein product [Rhizoctonia solani]